MHPREISSSFPRLQTDRAKLEKSMQMNFSSYNETIFSVSQLTQLISGVIDASFSLVMVEGEVSNLRTPSSGHSYFTLKDEVSQIRAVLFRGEKKLLPFELENGQKLLCRGRLSVYKQRGEYQIIVEEAGPSGLGSLHLAFEQLKLRLEKEGLFDESRKRPLPAFPKKIGIVTSSTGAAIRDILRVLERRKSGLDVVISPSAVQGENAAGEIALAIERLNQFDDIDAIIVGRGGGSLEDLRAFNEEVVARAIHDSSIPVISAVGHESDYCISDFVADLRAPTPSAAAEMVARSGAELAREIEYNKSLILSSITSMLASFRSRLDRESAGLRGPGRRIAEIRMRLDELALRMEKSIFEKITLFKSELKGAAGSLDSLSPLSVLSRGYSIATVLPGNKILKDQAQVKGGDMIGLKLARGSLECRVENKK